MYTCVKLKNIFKLILSGNPLYRYSELLGMPALEDLAFSALLVGSPPRIVLGSV